MRGRHPEGVQMFSRLSSLLQSTSNLLTHQPLSKVLAMDLSKKDKISEIFYLIFFKTPRESFEIGILVGRSDVDCV